MVEELFSAGATSVPYSLAVYYLCELRGSFFIVWLIFYVTNAVGISKTSAQALHPNLLLGVLAICLPDWHSKNKMMPASVCPKHGPN